jgi:hypothetical protein
MAWQVRTRAVLARLVRETPLLASAVSLSTVVESYRVALRAVVVGEAREAAAVEGAVRARIESEAGVVPLVTVTAVPRASAEATPASLPAPAVVPVIVDSSPDAAARVLADSVAETLRAMWPAAAGRLLSHTFTLAQDAAELRLVLLGPDLEPTAAETLERAITGIVKRTTRVTAVSVPSTVLRAEPGRGAAWLQEAASRVSLARHASGLFFCVEAPTRRVARDAPARAAVSGWVEEFGADRVAVVDGTAWSIRLRDEPCPR